jgi:hypothetical protein
MREHHQPPEAHCIVWIGATDDLAGTVVDLLATTDGGVRIHFASRCSSGLRKVLQHEPDSLVIEASAGRRTDSCARVPLRAAAAVVRTIALVQTVDQEGIAFARSIGATDLLPPDEPAVIAHSLVSHWTRRIGSMKATPPVAAAMPSGVPASERGRTSRTEHLSNTLLLIAASLAGTASRPATGLREFVAVAEVLQFIGHTCDPLSGGLSVAGAGDVEDLEARVGEPADDMGALIQDLETARSILDAQAILEKSRAGRDRITFYRRVSRHLGHSPRFWRQTAVLRRAAQLLGATTEQVAQIAYAIGYDHPSPFDRAFLRLTGFAPREYRKLATVDHGHCNI